MRFCTLGEPRYDWAFDEQQSFYIYFKKHTTTTGARSRITHMTRAPMCESGFPKTADSDCCSSKNGAAVGL